MSASILNVFLTLPVWPGHQYLMASYKFFICPFPLPGSAYHLIKVMSPTKLWPTLCLKMREDWHVFFSFSHQVHLNDKQFGLFPKSSIQADTAGNYYLSNLNVHMNHLGFPSSADSAAGGLGWGPRSFINDNFWWCRCCWSSGHTLKRRVWIVDGIRAECQSGPQFL